MIQFSKEQLILIRELAKSQYFDGKEENGKVILNGREVDKEKLYEIYMTCDDAMKHYQIS